VPSVYTIEGASRPRKRRKGGRTRQQKKFAAAAKRCSREARKRGVDYKQCMSSALRR